MPQHIVGWVFCGIFAALGGATTGLGGWGAWRLLRGTWRPDRFRRRQFLSTFIVLEIENASGTAMVVTIFDLFPSLHAWRIGIGLASAGVMLLAAVAYTYFWLGWLPFMPFSRHWR